MKKVLGSTECTRLSDFAAGLISKWSSPHYVVLEILSVVRFLTFTRFLFCRSLSVSWSVLYALCKFREQYNMCFNRVPKCDVTKILFLEYCNFGLKF